MLTDPVVIADGDHAAGGYVESRGVKHLAEVQDVVEKMCHVTRMRSRTRPSGC